MDKKIKRLLLGIAVLTTAVTLLASGSFAVYAAPDDSWLAVDWNDTKDDIPEITTSAPTTVPPTSASAPTTPPTTPPTVSSEQMILSGKKTWNHGANPASKRPDFITVIVKAGDIIIIQRRISAADHWAWSFRLPKYDTSGKEIIYTVNEARMENYIKQVNGYSLTNTYSPGRNTDESDPAYPNGSSGPKTEDPGNRALWLSLAAVCLLGIAVMILLPRKRAGAR